MKIRITAKTRTVGGDDEYYIEYEYRYHWFSLPRWRTYDSSPTLQMAREKLAILKRQLEEEKRPRVIEEVEVSYT